jgi:rhodanese-related sulfurtransferase
MRDEGHVYLDVRTVEEFELGHPEGAYNVPWQLVRGQEPNPDFGRVVERAFAHDQPLIVGCRTGQRSVPASAALLALGFVHVVEQHAGYAGKRDAFGGVVERGWEQVGLPTATQPQVGHSYGELREGVGAAEPGA